MKHSPKKSFIQWLLLSILMICLSIRVNCQELFSNPKSLQLSFGPTHYRIIDELFTQKKVKFSGTIFSSKVKYEKSTPKHIFGASIGYSQGKVKNLASDVKVTLHDLQAAISYQKVLSNCSILGKEGKLSAGAQISLLDYVLIDDDILENATVTFNYLLDVLVTQKIDVNPQHRFALSLVLPIAGFIKREVSDGGANQQLEKDFNDNPGRFFIKG
ncbi:MAG: hypothetical protein KDD63_21200, partial [Bacteroidetes bacterium]|nr:hypothetical protein [Bacteroidota bacterium]